MIDTLSSGELLNVNIETIVLSMLPACRIFSLAIFACIFTVMEREITFVFRRQVWQRIIAGTTSDRTVSGRGDDDGDASPAWRYR